MKKTILFPVFSVLVVLSLNSLSPQLVRTQIQRHGKQGLRAIITPSESIWLAGYASRTHPSDGVLADLWVKVLAIRMQKGRRQC